MNKIEQDIIELLKKKNHNLTVSQIAKKLNLEKQELKENLCKLEETLKIKKEDNGTYKLLETKNMRSGILSVNVQGVGFVKIGNNSEIKVPANKLNGAIHGDTVLISIRQNKKGKLEGTVEEKLSRDLGIMSGIIQIKDNIVQIKNDDLRYKINIVANNVEGLVEGHHVLFKITEQDENGKYLADVVKISDHKNDVWADVIALVKAMGIEDVFPDEVLEEASNLPTEVIPDDLINRRDLREKIIFTIDGADAKDLDDALSLEINEQGNYVLGVHIADVSHYVPVNSKIGKEAYNRGTSIYLVDRAIPMLPHSLSNGICSLTEGVDRLTLTCEIELTPLGDIVKYDIYPSVINSKKRMVYSEVNKILENKEMVPGYENFAEILNNMQELSHLARTKKEQRGTIDFGTNETYIKVNDNGEPIDVILRTRGESEKIIEDFMMLANEGVAKSIYDKELPFLYRNHLTPNEEKIDQVLDLIASIGYEVKKQSKDNCIDCAKTFQVILEELKDNPDFAVISKIMVRSMKKAHYSATNEKHFGIASECYTHFTAPIRRYPDLTVHRLLKKYIIENKYNKENLKLVELKLAEIAKHSSSREIAADECEREVIKMKHAEYMEKYIGEEFNGYVSNITRTGMYVQLDNLIQGLIAMNKLDKSFVYDHESITLTSVNLDLIYKIGSNVKIVVDNADKEMRIIGFSLAENNEEKDFAKTYKLR
ncbi:MAG: ribonuclease R [Bacilli bacterium]|nr:ribonuclease R [Bacilli bacterium]MDD4718758.1 ribonuclease R [Bacilli bacterium]